MNILRSLKSTNISFKTINDSYQMLYRIKFGLKLAAQIIMIMASTLNNVYAAGGTMSGSGTEGDPYLVTDYSDLKAVGTTYGLDKVYLLIADIDASLSVSENSGAGFIPIGAEGSHFTGTFHGRGHVVKHLFINRPSTNGVGLFGWNNGTIDSLGVMNGSITGYSYHTGCLAGWSGGTVKTCYATGSVKGSAFVGCLVGCNGDGGTVSDCYATGSVEASNGCAGGLVGYNINSTVIRCYATGPVKNNSSEGAGGLVGYNSNGSLISQSYATGYVTAPARIGGLVGWNSNCTTNTSYWNIETSGQTSGCGDNSGSFSATGLTTAQMKNSSNFSGWNFSSVWTIRANNTYPGLQATDNAPFAFADTLLTSRTFLLSQLLLNDFDIEKMQSNLTLRVISASIGITDSINILTFPDPIVPGTVSIIKYRTGEVRTADTLWGNIATSIITVDTIPPIDPQNLVVTDSSSQIITIKWRKNSEPDFMQYRIYRSTTPNPTIKVDSTSGGITDTAKTLTGLVNGIRYYFRVTAIDSVGNESEYSNEVNATPADRIAPAVPQNLIVTDSSTQTIAIKWRKNTEIDFQRYRIYRGTSPNPSTQIDSTSGGITDTTRAYNGLVDGTRYYFRVKAIDIAGNESGYSNEVNAVPADRIAPAAPQNLVIIDSSSQTITIAWQKNVEPDFQRYQIYCEFTPIPTASAGSTTGGITDTTKTFNGLVDGMRYYFRVTAIDIAGNESGYSNVVNAVPADRIAPAAPQNLVITDSANQTITIRWSKNTEADFMLYRIYQGTSPNPTTTVDSTSGGITDTAKALTGLINGMRYYFRVTAIDSVGNESEYSNEVNATPADRVAPNAPQNLIFTYSYVSTITIGWQRNTEADFMLYRIYQSTSPNPTTVVDSMRNGITDTAKTFTELSIGTHYYFRVTAVDSASNESDYSNEIDAIPQPCLDVQEEDLLHPTVFSLAQNFPNPFNPTTTITFTLSENGYVSLKVFDILGREVVTLVDAQLRTGIVYHAILDASRLSTGLYFYRLEAGKNIQVKKLMLLK